MNDALLDTLYFIAQKGWTESAQSYFAILATHLGNALGAQYALIDELLHDGASARTVGFYSKGAVVPNLEYALTGTPCENVIGKTLCCYPSDIQKLFPTDKMLVDMGAESYLGVPLWNSKGAPNGLIAAIWTTPLSPEVRQNAEAILQIVAVRCAHELDAVRSEFRLREYGVLLHSLNDGFCFTDHRGHLLDVNAAYCHMTGYTAVELQSMRVFDIEEKESTPGTRSHIRYLIAHGTDRFETRLRRKDGAIIEVEISAHYLPSDGGRFAVMVRDITAPKQAMREREYLRQQLEHAQKLEAVGRLAGGVSHDFNNMLAVILGQSELLLEDPTLSEATRADVLEIRGAAERSAALTSQLLAFARKQPAAPKVIDLNTAIDRMLRILRRLIGENIELQWEPYPELWQVLIDPTQVDQILANLCVNARDAIAGTGTVSIATTQGQYCLTAPVDDARAVSQTGEYVCLTVSDNGAGMDEATKKHIFEPFFSTKTYAYGTGLGLATVYGIVDQNGGHIEVESEPASGATFRLFFPRCRIEAQEKLPSPTIGHARLEGVTILLVEDEPRVMRLVAAMLASIGYEVVTAAGPLEALHAARQKNSTIDLVLTDVVMPGMNGRLLYDEIRKICPNAACLYMSGYNAEVVAHQGVLEKGIHFIQKPFKRGELHASIQAALGCDTRVQYG